MSVWQMIFFPLRFDSMIYKLVLCALNIVIKQISFQHILIKQDKLIIMMDWKDSISSKPGLYLQLAKSQGYQVIQYSSNGNENSNIEQQNEEDQIKNAHNILPIFSTNCNITCKIPQQLAKRWVQFKHGGKQVPKCPNCQQQLNLYFDYDMSTFSDKVRIDLAFNRYLSICKQKQGNTHIGWQNLSKKQLTQPSHIKYLRAVHQRPEQKQEIENFYKYQVLPVPKSKSYWKFLKQIQNYQQTMSFCLCSKQQFEIKQGEKQQQKDVILLFGDNQYLIDNILHFGDIVGCNELNNFIAILTFKQCYLLHLYQIINDQSGQPQIKSVYRIKIQIQFECTCASINFCNQSILINFLTQNQKQPERICYEAKIFCLQNCISSSPTVIQVDYFKILFPLQVQGKLDQQQISPYIFTILNYEIFNINIEIKVVIVQIQQNWVRVIVKQGQNQQNYTIENKTKMRKIEAHYEDKAKSKIYLFDFSEGNIKIIIFKMVSKRVDLHIVNPQNYVVISQCKGKNKNKLLYRKPQVIGCLIYSYQQINGQVCNIKSVVQ